MLNVIKSHQLKIKVEKIIHFLNDLTHLPASSSESLINVSCIVSGAVTLYFSLVVVTMVLVVTVSVTTFNVSAIVMYPSLCAMVKAV